MLRRRTLVQLLIFALAGWTTAASGNATVRIMTQNMDAGTDQGYIIAALQGAMSLQDAVDLTYAELQASRLEQRAALLAYRIAQRQPDLVVLQEATLWRTGPGVNQATIPLFDQLFMLQMALYRNQVPYRVVAVNTVFDVTLPGNQIPALRFTDRDALLVRTGKHPAHVDLSNVQTHIFDASFPFGPFNLTAGWISAEVGLREWRFQLFATHLQSAVAGIPQATEVQVAQAQQLLEAAGGVTGPVVICGDFNSDANDNPAVLDYTPTADLIRAAGYADVWQAIHGSDPGNTWPLYLEDQIPQAFPPASPVERIDILFARGLQNLGGNRILGPAPQGLAPPFESDHAGVIATFGAPKP